MSPFAPSLSLAAVAVLLFAIFGQAAQAEPKTPKRLDAAMRADRSEIPIPYLRVGKRDAEVDSPVMFDVEAEAEARPAADADAKRRDRQAPAFAFMRNSDQGPWFVRSLGSLRLTKKSPGDTMAVPIGGIPMARIGRGGPEMIPVARIGKKAGAAMMSGFEQIPMARLGKRDAAFQQIPMARVGRDAFNQIPMARVGRDAFQQIPMARLGRSPWPAAAAEAPEDDLDRYLESSHQPRGRDEYGEYDPMALVVPALKNLIRRIEENERMK